MSISPPAQTATPASLVHGYVAEGFESVREEFVRNLRERDELGGAFCAQVNGTPVVDIWGGTADAGTGRPWESDTLEMIFSASKGIVAITLLVLVDRGRLDLDAPVAHYWPEFGAAGKSAITLRQVITYTAQLPGIRASVSQDDIQDPRAMAELLAGQAPESDSRAEGILYGPFTMGWIVAEVVRRVDGRSIDRFFAEEIAGPHGLDIHFGIPAEHEHRVARLEYGQNFLDQYTGFFTSGDALTQRIWQNPVPFPHEEMIWNRSSRRTSLVPAANVFGTARSLSALYGILAADAVRTPGEPYVLVSRAVADDARREYVRKVDQLINIPMVYGGAGFRLRTTPRPGADGDSFGHDGGGGSAHLAWPGAGVGVSYVTNRLIAVGPDDKRAGSLLKALAAKLNETTAGLPDAR
ncbi:serine hydrolase domain-containing protein [Streptomyces sp. NPDC048442]|uniref:serine hydrolase domain-containing protein n=1 Tax=Streptomyces sp. NPDC048442 TaxID=3154823 RepID=UPI0034499376